MAQVFVCTDNKDLKDLLEINLNTHLHGVGVFYFTEPKTLLEGLKNSAEKVVLIIAQNGAYSDGQTLKDLNSHLETLSPRPALVIIGEAKGISVVDLDIDPISGWPELIKFAKKILNISNQKIADELGKYVSIPIHLFRYLRIPPANVYTAVFTTDHTKPHYLQHFKAFEEISENEISNLAKSGFKELWVPAKNRIEFSTLLSNELVRMLMSTNPVIREIAIADGYDFIKAFLPGANFSGEMVQLCDVAVKSMEKSLVNDRPINNYLTKLKTFNELKYTYELGQSTFLLSSLISQKMTLGGDPADRINKMAYVSFLRDISLMDDKWGRLRSNDDLENVPQITTAQKIEVLCHARESARLLSSTGSIPFEISQLILEHHGSKSGEGFSQNIKSEIRPLAMLHFLIEELTSGMLLSNNKGNELFDVKLRELKSKYSKPWTQDILQILESLRKK